MCLPSDSLFEPMFSKRKEQKAQADRLSKQQIKALDALMNMSVEEKKQETEQDKITSTEKIKAAELLQKMSSTS